MLAAREEGEEEGRSQVFGTPNNFDFYTASQMRSLGGGQPVNLATKKAYGFGTFTALEATLS